jgi:PAS domain S-box-containing protein
MSALFAKKNTLLDIVTPQYFDTCLVMFGDPKIKSLIKGRFSDIQYTLSGYDVTDLSHEDKKALVDLLFHADINQRGEKQAVLALEELINKMKERLGPGKDFDELLPDLPEEVFKNERISLLSRPELETKYRDLLLECSKTKDALNMSVSHQTVDLVAEKDILRITLYNTSDGVFAVDRNGHIVTFNKKMEELTGYSYEEVKEKKADEIVRLFDDTVTLDSEKYNPTVENISEKNVYSNNRVTLVTRNGVKKYVRMVSAVITENSDANIGSIVTLTDITKEIELENMKLDFVSIAAHELRTPLTSIRGYLDLLNSSVMSTLTEDAQKYLRKVIISADQLHILVENLLNVSRIEKGSLILNKKGENLEALVSYVISNFTEISKQAGVTVSYIKPQMELPEVFVDHTMISEVLSNLIDNGIKYNKPSGSIVITADIVDDKVMVHVKDTGVGIPTEAMPHIFKKFYRTSTSALTSGRKGTGLGLFISKQIVELHGGQISVNSVPGEGTTFSFSLPINRK